MKTVIFFCLALLIGVYAGAETLKEKADFMPSRQPIDRDFPERFPSQLANQTNTTHVMIIVLMPVPVRIGNLAKAKLLRREKRENLPEEEVHSMAVDDTTGDLYHVEPREICYHHLDKEMRKPLACEKLEKKVELAKKLRPFIEDQDEGLGSRLHD